MAELETVFRAPVINGYGMTECFPITSTPLPPRERKAGSVGVAAGTEIAVLDEAGNLLPPGAIGEIAVSGSQLMQGYLNQSTDSTNSFINGWFKTGDQGYVDADGYYFLTGRLKEIINRGGEKISPQEIDDVLLQHPSVSEAATFAVPHVTLGEDIAAAIVLKDHAALRDGEIQSFAGARLAGFKVPHRVLFVDQIPKTPNGKVQRNALAEKLGLTEFNKTVPGKEATRTEAWTPAEEKLRKIWAQVLGLATVGIHDNFFDLGGHSILAEQLIARIEDAFGKRLPVVVLFQAPTIEQLARLIGEKPPASFSSLVPIQPAGSKPPFFWVHGDFSNAFLQRYLGPDQPLYGLEHQSQDGKPALYTEVETIAAHYLEQIRTVQAEGPYFLGGYSFGGTVAFEMAQQLKKQKQDVALLVLLDSHFPGDSVPSSHNVRTNAALLNEFRRHLRHLSQCRPWEKLAYALRGVQTRITGWTSPARRLLRKVRWKLHLRMGHSIPPSLRSPYILDMYGRARRNYRPQVYRGCALYVKSERRPTYHYSNWAKLFPVGLEFFEVPGDHEDLRIEPYVRPWAENLNCYLEKAQERDTAQEKNSSS